MMAHPENFFENVANQRRANRETPIKTSNSQFKIKLDKESKLQKLNSSSKNSEKK